MDLQERHNVTWREYELIENSPAGEYRRDMIWRVFDDKANRLANLLLKRGIKKGDKVAIFLMNCPGVAADLFWHIKNRRYRSAIKSMRLANKTNFNITVIRFCFRDVKGSVRKTELQ